MKLLISSVLLLCSFEIFGAPLPRMPESCFSQKNFCTAVNTLRESGVKKIKIRVFGKISKTEFSDIEEVYTQYFDFASWPEYVTGSENIDFNESRSESYQSRGGQSLKAHYFDYWIKVPFPINRMHIVGLSAYEDVTEDFPTSLRSVKFYLVGNGSKGLKEYKGYVHIASSDNGDHYYLYFDAVVLPNISIGLGLAGPYIERPLSEIFTGMFRLDN